jgi:c-di-GMP-binding flagellar brake protein YcgR
MTEKRNYVRYSLDVSEVNGMIALASDVRIVDISLGGIALKADRRLNIGSEYSLRLEDKKDAVSLRCSVVRCSVSESRKRANGSIVPIYEAGMKFTDTSPEKEEQLRNFIARNKTGALAALVDHFPAREDGNRRQLSRSHADVTTKKFTAVRIKG